MDLLTELHAKIETLAEYESIEGVRAAIRHIEVAERHLVRGRDENDEDAFNDVIYRTNQAFEGMLEEAYVTMMAAGTPSSKLTLHQIEQQFASDGRLSARLLTAFQRYRQEWRNASTHDHKLLFSEQDALLAIVSVSAFAAILLDQIIASASCKNQRDVADRQRVELDRALKNYDRLDFNDQVVTLLIAFSSNLCRSFAAGSRQPTEAELIGGIAGFLSAADPSLAVEQHARLSERETDLLLRKNNMVAPLEIKRGGRGYFLDAAAEQVKAMLEDGGLRIGFVFMPPRKPTDTMGTAHLDWAGEDRAVAVVAPQPFIFVQPEGGRPNSR